MNFFKINITDFPSVCDPIFVVSKEEERYRMEVSKTNKNCIPWCYVVDCFNNFSSYFNDFNNFIFFFFYLLFSHISICFFLALYLLFLPSQCGWYFFVLSITILTAHFYFLLFFYSINTDSSRQIYITFLVTHFCGFFLRFVYYVINLLFVSYRKY